MVTRLLVMVTRLLAMVTRLARHGDEQTNKSTGRWSPVEDRMSPLEGVERAEIAPGYRVQAIGES
jgi:hypothetical protein